VSPARRIVVAGFGLIGGSLGMALERAGFSVGYLDPAVELSTARDRRAASFRLGSPDELHSDDLVAVATPVDVALDLVPRVAQTGALVTTLCSVMKPFASIENVVASHPFAGSEKSGFAAADENLFRDRTWFVDANATSHEIDPIITAAGATIVRISAAEHDEALAYTSHLPQLISTALASLIEKRGLERFAGSGLKTILRLAGSDVSVWKPIFDANEEALERAVADLEKSIGDVLEDPSAEFPRANVLWKKLT
jgi:prephenate dehydrogenase